MNAVGTNVVQSVFAKNMLLLQVAGKAAKEKLWLVDGGIDV